MAYRYWENYLEFKRSSLINFLPIIDKNKDNIFQTVTLIDSTYSGPKSSIINGLFRFMHSKSSVLQVLYPVPAGVYQN